MKFNCGPSKEERYEVLVKEVARLGRWHDHFCWWPTRAGRYCYWFETIERVSPNAWVCRNRIIDSSYGAKYRVKENNVARGND